jgi:hemerythrin-like domain-containing protein
MRRHEILVPLSREHHQGLLLAQLMKKGAPPYKGMPESPSDKIRYAKVKAEQLLKPHFRREEKVLFLFLADKAKEMMEAYASLYDDHRRLMDLIDRLNPQDPDVDLMDDFGQLLDAHIRKEERGLFQEAQHELKEKDWEQLGRLLEET